ncbi:late embryogenesis abundant protein At1g64065-like [Rhododendron vialii]|uniref:late embryogenesis abundant protein At1g64065-like n=1 Tax=Rhododendron vialii TaxID=182163 RepID=UPI00265FBF78|nr:late embryogenesis abundant protein At1g64065-like [Rhododendron vialii]
MAEENKEGYPTAPPADGSSRSAEEAGKATSNELRRQKRKKLLLYGLAFVIFLTGIIIVLFSTTFMKIRTPEIQFQSGTFGYFNVQFFDAANESKSPSFNVSMNAVLGIKNSNFGPYKYDSTTVYFFDNGIQVGSAIIPKSKASFRSTKKINVPVNLVSPTNLSMSSLIGFEIGTGLISLTIQSELNGKVELMFGVKKKKTIDLNCYVDILSGAQEITTIICN